MQLNSIVLEVHRHRYHRKWGRKRKDQDRLLVDEEEGSSSRELATIQKFSFEEVFVLLNIDHETGKIERSAEALRVYRHPISFPPCRTP